MVDETEAGKGRRTPTRKEAEAARKKQMKVPMTRKEQAKRERAAREEIRLKQREALKTGDEKYLPLRERGPVRKFCRDYVDRRWNFAEFLLPFLVVAFLIMIAGSTNANVQTVLTSIIYPVVIVGTLIDEFVMVRGLKKQIKQRFSPDDVKGNTAYAVLRTTQLRRFRLPKPQVKRGAPLAQRY
ncbi:DUF3043 domain-containing protein [Aeromicrobium ginsengisoli]|uniref:DUF3043 domain-containing protein n=1 Tax=Aeromicrobium ginsengisoli TaxID=363867 RepID=A0A5M4FHW3_9ACTN|nr:DUF3043 domain-containing protein [Aeromicrobium ginsengisoli]KAA1399784.1 DUF3043 domain-containing protein [Aeromicrobium ginsengisoli]